ncbi:type VI secretion system tip protein VgrG [Pseudomonas sp. COR58]|uniref:Type VI secretion system tip protein VgrG n=1 Tax=Pseudomonas ekonensis TaxID=2842353 RepID=A0ABS6PB70_9PSED|nr:contractile injection system protein, VgrG/Pvc8 family [Pseudomonas ekonensis]MBV4457705.1 type VI secretion system tip protein VgrG [Pseudomonas ekonensis]
MHNDKESPFTLTLADGALTLPVLRFSGREALNRPYRFEVEAIGVTPALTPDALLHQPAFLRLNDQQGIHGTIHSVGCEHRAVHQTGYRLVLVPHLQRLDQAARRRVFVNQSVPAIIERLLTEHRLPPAGYRLEMTVGQYPPRPFCIQYEETDLALLRRLCEEEGIHFHFEHRCDGHVAVFADDSLSLPPVPATVVFGAQAGASPSAISVLFQRHDAVCPPMPPTVLERGHGNPDGTAANHTLPPLPTAPGSRSAEAVHADQRSRRHLQRQRCANRCIQGQSDATELRSGHLLLVADHPMSTFNEQWLITELRHQGRQPSILQPASPPRHYRNDFTAQPWSTEYRPPQTQPRPRIPGFQPAQVVGAPGAPAQVDEQGRMAVRLWPEQCHDAEPGVLWLAIASATAAGRIACEHLPCAGSRVWVSFLDSDPDRPIVFLDACHARPAPSTTPAPADGLLLDWLLNRAAPS